MAEEHEEPTAPLALKRPHSEYLDACLGVPFPVLDHGFIRVIDYMGDAPAIVQAARVSYGKGTKTPSEDRGLLRYLIRHRHTSPLEMCEIKLHVKLPIFVARQWIRHRTASVNEYSARYSILSREFYVPAPEDIAPQSTTNKQGREGGYEDHEKSIIALRLEASMTDSFDYYEGLIDKENGFDLARELARIVTPMSTYTEWYWKVNLHNLLHFLTLRADPHAQKEIRVYAETILDLVKGWVPAVGEAFEDYMRQAMLLSAQEVVILKAIMDGGGALWDAPTVAAVRALSKRELDAFVKAFGLEDIDWGDIRGER